MKKLLLCLACATGLMLAGAFPAHALTFEEFRGKANDLFDRKINPDAFIKLSNDVLAKDVGQDADFKGYVHALRGHAYWLKDDTKKARADAQKAIEANPQTELGHIVMAEALASEGKLEESATEYDKAAGNSQDNDRREGLKQAAAKMRTHANAIPAATLWKDFDANEVAAEDKYKGKVIAVKGTISSITTSPMGYPQVTFSGDKYGLNNVVCEFSKDDKGQIAKLKKGEKITLTGTCQGMVIKSVYIRNAKLL